MGITVNNPIPGAKKREWWNETERRYWVDRTAEHMLVDAWEDARMIAKELRWSITRCARWGATREWPTDQPIFRVHYRDRLLFTTLSVNELLRFMQICKEAVDATGERQAEIVIANTGQMSKRQAFWSGFTASAVIIAVIAAFVFLV